MNLNPIISLKHKVKVWSLHCRSFSEFAANYFTETRRHWVRGCEFGRRSGQACSLRLVSSPPMNLNIPQSHNFLLIRISCWHILEKTFHVLVIYSTFNWWHALVLKVFCTLFICHLWLHVMCFNCISKALFHHCWYISTWQLRVCGVLEPELFGYCPPTHPSSITFPLLSHQKGCSTFHSTEST